MRLIPIVLSLGLISAPVTAAENLDAALQELAADVLSFFEGTPPEKIAISTMIHGDGHCSALSERASNRFQGALFRAKPDETAIIDRRSLSAIFREQELIEDGTVSPEGAAKIARIAQVDAIVTGTVSRYGQQIDLEASMLDAVTGTVMGFSYSSFPLTQDDRELIANKSPSICNFANNTASATSENASGSTAVSATPDASFGDSNSTYQSEIFDAQIVSLIYAKSSGEATVSVRFLNKTDKAIGLSYHPDSLSLTNGQGGLFAQGELWSGLRICSTNLSYCTSKYPTYVTKIAAGAQAQLTFNATAEPQTEASALSLTWEMVAVPDYDNGTENNIVSVGFFDVQPTIR